MRYRNLILFLLLAAWLGLSALPVLASLQYQPRYTTRIAYPVVLADSGIASQQGQRVASLRPGRAGARLVLQLADFSQSQDLQVVLPHPLAPSQVQASFQSIQGTDGMQAELTTPTNLLIELPPLLAESHTSVTLGFPAGYCRLGPLLRLLGLAADAGWQDWLLIGIALLIANLMAAYWNTPSLLPWRSAGKADGHLPKSITPDKFSLLLHGGIQRRDMAALIIDLAQRGALEVVERDGELYLIRHYLEVTTIKPYENALIDLLIPPNQAANAISAVLRDISRDIFSKQVSEIYASIYDDMQGSNYFVEKADVSHLRLKTLGIALQFASLAGVAYYYFTQAETVVTVLPLFLAEYAAGYALYRISQRAAYLTPVGRYVWELCRNFVRFLEKPEPIPAEYGAVDAYYRFLPYAVIGNVSEQWAARFAGQSFSVPFWFTSAHQDVVDQKVIADRMNKAAQYLAYSFAKVKDPNVD